MGAFTLSFEQNRSPLPSLHQPQWNMCCKASSTGESSWVYIAQTLLFLPVFRCQTCRKTCLQTYHLLGKSFPFWASLLEGCCCHGQEKKGVQRELPLPPAVLMALVAPAAPQATLSYTVETPEGHFLISREQSRTSLQPGSAQQGDDSALHHRLAARGWCGLRLPAGTAKRENFTRCKAAMCWKD